MAAYPLPIRQPNPSVNVFGDRLNINNKRDITSVMSGPQAAGLLSGEKFLRDGAGERAKIMNKNTPITAPKASERAVPGLFNDMGYHASVPTAPGEPRRAAPTSIANTEPQTNVRTPVMRILHAPYNGSMQDLPSRNELLFLKKTRETDTVSFLLKRASKTLSNMESYTHNDPRVRVNTRPMLGFNCGAIQQHGFIQFSKLAAENPDRYRQLQFRDFWRGVDDLNWTGWTLDSAVTLEMDGGNHSTAQGDQYSNSQYGNQLLRPAYNSETKVLTCGISGQHELCDYWCSRGIQEGASLWIVGKMYNPTRYAPQKKEELYIKSRKAQTLQLSMDAVARVPIRQIRVTDPADSTRIKEVPLMAPGFFFVANPSGGDLDPSLAQYENEWGDLHMGVILPVGRVLFLPPHFKQQPPIENGTEPYFTPFTDATEAMVREPLTVLLHSNKDGGMGLY